MKDREQVSADAQIAAESQGARTVLIPQNMINGAKETRASWAQDNVDNQTPSNDLPVPVSQEAAAKDGLSQANPTLFSTQLEKQLAHQVYAGKRKQLLNQNTFKI